MSRALFGHVWRGYRVRLLIVAAALALWGSLPPIIYDAFGEEIERIMNSGLLPSRFAELTQFGGGDLFSLAGSVALGFIHPIAVGLGLVFAVGFAGASIAGERQRGTLEVLLARPVSRRRVYATMAIAAAMFIGLTLAALTLGSLGGAALTGRVTELGPGNLPVLWLNAFLLYAAFGAISLAASVTFDRLAPAVGLGLAVVLISYFLDVLGDLWPDAAWVQPYSLFHYLDARGALSGLPEASNFVVLAVVAGVAVVYALIVFPRKDLAAPS